MYIYIYIHIYICIYNYMHLDPIPVYVDIHTHTHTWRTWPTHIDRLSCWLGCGTEHFWRSRLLHNTQNAVQEMILGMGQKYRWHSHIIEHQVSKTRFLRTPETALKPIMEPMEPDLLLSWARELVVACWHQMGGPWGKWIGYWVSDTSFTS